MKTTLLAIFATMLLATMSSAQVQTAVGVAPVVSTITVRPDVSDSTSIELWTVSGERILVYRGATLPIVPRDPNLILKVVLDPSATEGDLSKDRSLDNGEEMVHLNTKEIAVLVNGKGIRVQNLSKNPSEVSWRTTDLPPTTFIATQSKVLGGYSHTGVSDVLGIHRDTPQAKGGSYSPALYVEPAQLQLTGNDDADLDQVINFQIHKARKFGITVQENVTTSDKTSTTTEAPVNQSPVKLLGVTTVTKNGQTKTVVTIFQNGVHIKVVAVDGKCFSKSVTYHGESIVSADGHTIECDHDGDQPMVFPGKCRIQIFANNADYGTWGD